MSSYRRDREDTSAAVTFKLKDKYESAGKRELPGRVASDDHAHDTDETTQTKKKNDEGKRHFRYNKIE